VKGAVMKNILAGKYSQIKESIDCKLAKEGIHTIQEFRTMKLIFFLVFFNAITYGMYAFNYYITPNFDELTVQLDEQNEYISFLPGIWFVHLIAFTFLCTAIVSRYYSGKHNVKGYLWHYVFMSTTLFLFLVYTFKFGQLFVTSFYERVVYAVIFSITIVFVIIKGYQNAVKMVYGSDIKQHPLMVWLKYIGSSLMAVLTVIAAPYYFIKTVFGSVGDFEQRLMGSLMSFIPLIVSVLMLFLLYFFSVIIRSYYLNKYSEEFRQKFGIEKEVWYGLKPYPKEDETEARAEDIQ